MPKSSIQTAAVSLLCLLAAAPAFAAEYSHHTRKHAVHRVTTRSYDGYGSTTPYYGSTAPYPSSSTAAASIVGAYTSDAFFPSPLQLTITGMDANGNLYGSLTGMESGPGTDKEEPAWSRWTRTFPSEKTQAVYRNGQVVIQFAGGGGYSLSASGNTLTGTFGSNGKQVTFLRRGATSYAEGQ